MAGPAPPRGCVSVQRVTRAGHARLGGQHNDLIVFKVSYTVLQLKVGICSAPCLNRGKCIQKDSCQCRPGFYGATCEFSKARM